MSTLYEIVELANGDIALQKEGDSKKATNGAPLVTMRFSTDLLRFLRDAKMDVAKVMIEAGLERVATLAESVSREELNKTVDTNLKLKSESKPANDNYSDKLSAELPEKRFDKSVEDDQHPTVSHLLH